uniref:Tpd52 like 2a n=1 Tax=Cyprinus carpio TaxID=7962 RepID=A0A8C1YR91_CYPCA
MSYWDSSPKNSSDVIVYSPLLCFKACGTQYEMILLFSFWSLTITGHSPLLQVLVAKERHAAELKRRLGISPISEIKQNLTHTYIHTYIYQINISTVYKRTQETLSQAGQMTSAAFSSMGSAIRNQFGEMRFLKVLYPPRLHLFDQKY